MEKRESVESGAAHGGSLYGTFGWSVPQTLAGTTAPANSFRIEGDAWRTLEHALHHGDESSRVLAELVIYRLVYDVVVDGLFDPMAGVMCQFADRADRTIEKAVAFFETGLR